MHTSREFKQLRQTGARGAKRERRGARARGRLGVIAAASAMTIVLPGTLGANGERTITLYNIHTKESLRVVYKRNGMFVPEALKKLNWFLRDWRRNEPTNMDPEVIDLVWQIHAELGSRVPIRVISGYRSPTTNNLLRKTRGGQAKRSQHLLGKAMDVSFPDIPVRRLRYSALLREQGGVGYYPTSATPFVHIDTGRVRHWPRMGRQELALLFPNGRTQHHPSSGGPITRADAIVARRENPGLAQRVAAFFTDRFGGAGSTRIASAEQRPAPPPPQRIAAASMIPPKLLQQPKIARAPQRPKLPADAGGWSAILKPVMADARAKLASHGSVAGPLPPATTTGPQPYPFRPAVADISSHDRSRLSRLASANAYVPPTPAAMPAPRPMRPRVDAEGKSRQADNWISAPAYDEEHPEELFYRPFPIAPFITQTASADDPALQHMTHPDIDRTLALLVEDGTAHPPLQMRPGFKVASLLWSQTFSGAGAWTATRVTQQQEKSAIGRRMVRLADGR